MKENNEGEQIKKEQRKNCERKKENQDGKKGKRSPLFPIPSTRLRGPEHSNTKVAGRELNKNAARKTLTVIKRPLGR